MQQVITAEVAKRITGGRAPLVPVEYEQAVTALAACTQIDEAKYWNAKADALAAWAKIYRDDKVERQARALKLHAYRRMGEIARELRPKTTYGSAGRNPGALALLTDAGVSLSTARAAIDLTRIPKIEFEKAANAKRPPAPTTLVNAAKVGGSSAWRKFRDIAGPYQFRSWCRREDSREIARMLEPDEVALARAIVKEITEWLDDFDRFLPKGAV